MCFFCMFIVPGGFLFFSQVHVLKVTTCNTKVHLSLSAIRQHERAEVVLLILIVAIRNTLRFRVALILIVAMKNVHHLL